LVGTNKPSGKKYEAENKTMITKRKVVTLLEFYAGSCGLENGINQLHQRHGT